MCTGSCVTWQGCMIPIMIVGTLMVIVGLIPLLALVDEKFTEIKPFLDKIPSNLVIGLMALLIVWYVVNILLVIGGHYLPLLAAVALVLRGVLYFVIGFYHIALFVYIARYASKEMINIRKNWYVRSLDGVRKEIEKSYGCCGFGAGSVEEEVRLQDCGKEGASDTTPYCDDKFEPFLSKAQACFLGCSITTFLLVVLSLSCVCVSTLRPPARSLRDY